MEKLISNEMLIQRIKKYIDITDVKNDNEVNFQYIFNKISFCIHNFFDT